MPKGTSILGVGAEGVNSFHLKHLKRLRAVCPFSLSTYNRRMRGPDERGRLLESEIERRLSERFAALREEFERLRLESDGRWAGFASRFEQKVSGIVPAELLSSGEDQRAAGAGQLSIAEARELDGASTQVDILQKLLEICGRHASRAVLLVLRGGVFTVWKAVGFTRGSSPRDSALSSLSASGKGILARVADGAPCRLPAGNAVSEQLSCADAVDAILVPMTIGEKVSGALYADALAGKEKGFDPESIAFLSYLAGMLVERLPARKLGPSPALRRVEPATAAVAPAGSRRSASPPALAEKDAKRAEARRFAQLLVSEIKLYNERAVQEGREEGNLYARLKDEIDQSRRLYEERIPEPVRAGSDFLYDELVRILADGRAEALGIGFPGRSVIGSSSD